MYLKMVTSSLMRRRSRMLVALLAVAIGATVLSGLLTVYYDVPRQMGREFRSYGANLVLTASNAAVFTVDDLAAAEQCIPQELRVGVTGFRYENITINNQPFVAVGTDFTAVQKTSPYWYVSGNWPDAEGEVLLGQMVAARINVRLGSEVVVRGFDWRGNPFERRCTVAGIVQTGGSEEDCVYLARADLEALTQNGGFFDVAECSISASGAALGAIAERIQTAVPAVYPRLVKQVAHSEMAVLGKLQALVYIVTLIVLALTMVSVATTMMAVVAERRNEIGLKKALGAADKDIAGEFLGEGLFLGAAGGVLGVLFGFFFAYGVSMEVFSRAITFQPLLVPVTIAVAIVLTGVACVIPVRLATDVDPAAVLKGE
ncbi:MAG: FtsX-like permease family protein [Treponema sp.]|nr:FtsX-like permease family protein [Treponema sp.]